LVDALKRYQQEADNIAGFLAECCRVEQGLSYPRKELYLRYTEWCLENGLKATTKKKFNQRLREQVPSLEIGRERLGPEVWKGLTYVTA